VVSNPPTESFEFPSQGSSSGRFDGHLGWKDSVGLISSFDSDMISQTHPAPDGVDRLQGFGLILQKF